MRLVFSTKTAHPPIPKARLDETHAYITRPLGANHCPSIIGGGTENHEHMLVIMPRAFAISNPVRTTKASSTFSAHHH